MNQVVFPVLGWLSIVVVLMMMMILWITKVEIKNSRYQVVSQLILHYNHRFHRMRIAFEKHNIFNKMNDHRENSLSYFKRHNALMHDAIPILSNEISQNCMNNQFLFIEKADLRDRLTYDCKEMISDFHHVVYLYKQLEEQSKADHLNDFKEQWEVLTQKYDAVIERIIEVQKMLSNDVYLDIFKK
ncbi:MAG: hypothetical protein JXR88_11585 [Clostridia bacterium]|nr:hypothetical protein [Clostridia bacterium]